MVLLELLALPEDLMACFLLCLTEIVTRGIFCKGLWKPGRFTLSIDSDCLCWRVLRRLARGSGGRSRGEQVVRERRLAALEGMAFEGANRWRNRFGGNFV